ncbi:hypothetical protein COY90_03320 [Candidatus Roizmanbacteria bacterium CG_4_10_14_0_8_um_filter_39_9]|uniref:Uncharacterized protein n=1 Tax=Candidatus Roizmanbacteria bacterium CG_4_10_14_0_8_um_filter_39_9 TaxID=1974829 RepID=A0A2M7QCG9_9BACT|nr:MAG: hypothetical protein COY90_03320 [Candidatus Roizmanbacteria bacterium CG_4_10_14_0_8_um_filter_39_9]
MVRISPYKVTPEKYNKIFSIFYEVVGKQRKDIFNKVLFDLLSPAERIMIVKRIAIIYLLMKEIDYRIICKVLKVSYTSISKFRIMIEKSEGIVPALQIILKTERMYVFFEELFNDIFAPGVYGINWTAAWQRKLSFQRKKDHGL